jgi:hypothetical protein
MNGCGAVEVERSLLDIPGARPRFDTAGGKSLFRDASHIRQASRQALVSHVSSVSQIGCLSRSPIAVIDRS